MQARMLSALATALVATGVTVGVFVASHRSLPPRLSATSAQTRAADDLAPPLQADFARHGLARQFAHARDFEIEGIERVQMPSPVGGREQRCEPAVLVARAHQIFAMGERVRHGRRLVAQQTQSSS